MKHAINIVYLSGIVLVLITQFSFSQSIYFSFDAKSKEYYLKEDGMGNYVKEPVYIKNIKENGNIEFFIKGQMFVFEKAIMSKKSMEYNQFSEKVLSANEVVKYVNSVREQYPMWYKYPSSDYPLMYIVEKGFRNNCILYEVNWKYYTE